jgi:hypothetical protein
LGCKIFLSGSGTAGARKRHLFARSAFLGLLNWSNAMPFVPVPGTLAIDIIYTLDNQRAENTLYFERPDGWSLAQIITFMDALAVFISTDLIPLLASATQFVELIGRLLDTASSVGFNLPISPPVSGTNTSEPLPNNVTFTTSFRTGLSGRSFRGRNYTVGMPSDKVVGNLVTLDFRTGILDFYTGLIAFAADNDCTWVVVSRFSGVDGSGNPIPRVTGVTTPVLTVGQFDNVVDSQRRRLPGRGS